MAAMQIAGSVLAIPVGLGSAYSIYRANFSVDTTCQTLRANIISMIDKKIDATARRMLVRHDVETFEKVCGGVDPDAEAAFKTLLAEPAVSAVRRIETPAKAEAAKRADIPKVEPKPDQAKEARKPDLRAAVPAEPVREPARERSKETAREPVQEMPKQAAKEFPKAAAAEVPAQQHDAATDAQWLDAVRGALVAHEKTVTTEASADAAAGRGTPPHPLALPPPPVAAAPVAPELPPPTQIPEQADAMATPHPADPDRLVPPASIPEQTEPKPSGWLSKVPFVGQALAR